MSVLLCQQIELSNLQTLLSQFSLQIKTVADNTEIPGSFWQPPEAGLVGNILYIRNDTPVHSALHESCHYICMDNQRRSGLDTDAGGGYEEEDAVCYLQILLADSIPEMQQQRMFDDMDEWGYSFRLGSAKAWFDGDAEDAEAWLIKHKLIDTQHKLSFTLRQ